LETKSCLVIGKQHQIPHVALFLVPKCSMIFLTRRSCVDTKKSIEIFSKFRLKNVEMENNRNEGHRIKRTYGRAGFSGDKEGYNSSDEHGPEKNIRPKLTREEEFVQLSASLKEKGLQIKFMKEDGNCLFRAVADQLFGDQEMHDIVRDKCLNYMVAERDHFSQFVCEDFGEYIRRKRVDKCFGNNPEIQAISELYNRPIEIYSATEPLNIFQGDYVKDNYPIRMSYHEGNHYNSVIDPNNPTIGVGLGLPNLQPGVGFKLLKEVP
jgi:OTU domain-containing protein 5